MTERSFSFTVWAVAGILIFGTLNTIGMKIAYSFNSVGITGEEKQFSKPWFLTFLMFVAMSAALLCDAVITRCQRKRNDSNYKALADESVGQSVDVPADQVTYLKKVMLVSIPASFDIVATGLCGMGFVFLPASVWQLLRGAELVFAAFFAVTCLGRRLYAFHYLAIFICVIGISVVGLASVWGAEENSNGDAAASKNSANLMILGMALALGGQVVQAAQVIAEEWLLKDLDLPGPQVIGYEGVWGTALMLAIAFPLLWFIPGSDNGHFEDEADTFYMIANNGGLLILIMVIAFSNLTYNLAGIFVTEALSAVHRVMLEALRTALVWAFGLIVHYCFDSTSKFGEALNSYSWLEVVGFLLLILGQAIYGEIFRIKVFYYPPAEDETVLITGRSLRNLATPISIGPNRK